MGTNAVEKVGIVKPLENTTVPLVTEEIPQKTENLPELLSGDKNTDKKEEITPKEKDGWSLWKIWMLGMGVGFGLFFAKNYRLIKLGMQSMVHNIRKSRHIASLKKLRTNPKLFKPVSYNNPQNLQELKELAKQLGIKIKIEGTGKNDIEQLKEALYTLVQAHNAGKGRTVMPKELLLKSYPSTSNIAGQATTFTGKTIMLRREMASDTSFVTLHELGHINDFSFLSRSSNNAEFCRMSPDIRQSLREYATTDPDEFIADMYATLICWGDKKRAKERIPKQLIDLYHKLKGPFVPYFGFENVLYTRDWKSNTYLKKYILKKMRSQGATLSERLSQARKTFSLQGFQPQ